METTKNFTVNGKKYKAVDVDFLFLVHLDKCGVDMNAITSVAAVNAYFMYCTGMNEVQAAKEITEHVIANKEFPSELMNTYLEVIGESGFFRALMGADETSETEEESTSETAPKKKTARK